MSSPLPAVAFVDGALWIAQTLHNSALVHYGSDDFAVRYSLLLNKKFHMRREKVATSKETTKQTEHERPLACECCGACYKKEHFFDRMFHIARVHKPNQHISTGHRR